MKCLETIIVGSVSIQGKRAHGPGVEPMSGPRRKIKGLVSWVEPMSGPEGNSPCKWLTIDEEPDMVMCSLAELGSG